MSTEIKSPQTPELNADSRRGAEYEVVRELYARFGTETCHFQRARDGVPTLWVPREKIQDVLRFLKQLPKPFSMPYALSAIDEQFSIICFRWSGLPLPMAAMFASKWP